MKTGDGPDRGGPGDESPEPAIAPVPFRHFILYFLHLGTTGFGGPIATVGYMQRDLVEKRRWMGRKDFLDGVALGQTMPGPLAAQVAMWVGYLNRGPWGALAVAAAFIGPAFIIVIAVGALYFRFSGLPLVQSLFYGIAPAVMAIITIAAYKLLKLTDRRDLRLWGISAAVFAVTALTGSEPVPMILGAGILMLQLDARPALGLFFLQTGALVFGSGLAIVPLLRDGVVAQHHWLTQGQFLDAVAMGLITPGPVVITAGFIGYLVAGLPGAVIATVAIFTPIYLAVIIPGRWFIRHRDNKQVKAFVAGATAAAAGALSGAVVVLTREAVTDWTTTAIAVVSLGLLWRFKINEPYIVIAAGILGIVLH